MEQTEEELQSFMFSVAKDKVERRREATNTSLQVTELMVAAHGDRLHSKTVLNEVKKNTESPDWLLKY